MSGYTVDLLKKYADILTEAELPGAPAPAQQPAPQKKPYINPADR